MCFLLKFESKIRRHNLRNIAAKPTIKKYMFLNKMCAQIVFILARLIFRINFS